jgi:hypothetical protein
MRRIMVLVAVALVLAAMLAMGAGPVLAVGNPDCGLYGQNEWAIENEPGYVGEAVSGDAQQGGLAGNSGANHCSENHPPRE